MIKKHEEHGRFFMIFQTVLRWAMRWRWATIGVTFAIFAVALYGMQFVPKQFFPASDRPELLVDSTLPDNSTIHETSAQMDRFEKRSRAIPTSSAGALMSARARSAFC